MKKLTREQILDLRNSFGVWQQDYDSVHDKEQHDMFAMSVVAMNEMLAAMDGKDAERREWMALGVDSMARHFDELYATSQFPWLIPAVRIATEFRNSVRSGEVDL